MKVQVNNKEVEMTPASEWEKFALQENDNLVVIKAACGG